MSRRALRAINWSALAERVPEEERHIFSNFKSKSDQFLRQVQEFPENPPKINWDFYRKNVPTSGLVDQFQKQYESLQIPYPADNYTAKIEADAKEAFTKVDEYLKYANSEIEKASAEISRIKSRIPVSEMTMEEFKDAYPEYALDPLKKPTIYPHDPERQPGVEKFDNKSSH